MANFFHETVYIGPLSDIEISSKGTHTYIGKNSKVDNFVKIKHVGGTGNIVIGENVFLNSGTVLYSGNGIKIGDNVLVGPNCSIVPVNHNFTDVKIPIRLQQFLPSKGGIVIEEDVWIGAGVTILDGSFIEKGCIIGANSLVKGKLNEYSVYAGNPLTLIKRRK
jgi:virginiamycin A acetyltransferase